MELQEGECLIVIGNIQRDKSQEDDLNMELGIVSGRVALLLRSAEIKPVFSRFVAKQHNLPFGGRGVGEWKGEELKKYSIISSVKIIILE